MIGSRASTIAGALVAFAIAVPAAAQGKSGSRAGSPHHRPRPPCRQRQQRSCPRPVPLTAVRSQRAPSGRAPFSSMEQEVQSLTAPGRCGLVCRPCPGMGAASIKWLRRSSTARLVWFRLELGADLHGGGRRGHRLRREVGILKDSTSTLKLAITPTVEVASRDHAGCRAWRSSDASGPAGQHTGRPRRLTNLRQLRVFLARYLVHDAEWHGLSGTGSGCRSRSAAHGREERPAACRPAPASKRCFGRHVLRSHAKHCPVRIAQASL